MKTAQAVTMAAALVMLLLSGCVTRYQVRVDALSDPSGPVAGKNYHLVSATDGVSGSDLFFRELAYQLEPMLTSLGFHPTTKEIAHLRIAVDAHLSAPLVETRSYSEPIYVEQRGFSRVYRVPVVDGTGKVVSYVYDRHYEPSRTVLSGWVDRDQQITVYDKVLRLSAREMLPDGSVGDEVWTITAALRDSSTDYRKALPYLLAAMRDRIGTRTEGEETVTLSDSSPGVNARWSDL